MTTIAQAFETLRQNLELKPAERANAQNQQNTLRGNLRGRLQLKRDFLSGSYARHTAIRPLNDIDMIVVLDEQHHGSLRQAGPRACLVALRDALAQAYVNKAPPTLQGRSVHIDFSGTGIGYDVVPAFEVRAPQPGRPGIYEIPDREAGDWLRSSPEQHIELGTAANRQAGDKLTPLVKMAKHWNRTAGKPLKSFHLEVLAWSTLRSAPVSYPDGLVALFEGMARVVTVSCADPAGVGPAIDLGLTAGARENARNRLLEAARQGRRALDGERIRKDPAGAHAVWRGLLGAEYPERGSAPRGW